MLKLGLGLNINKNSVRVQSVAYSSEYLSILARGTALGYTLPSTSRQIKQNQLILDLKSAGIWNKLDVFYVYANDGSKEFATLNWKSPTQYQSTLVNSPTFTSDQGFTGDGVTSYIRTNFNPSTNGVNYQNNDASRGAYVRIPVSSQYVDGVANGNDLNHGFRIGTSQFNYINQDAGSVSPAAVYSTNANLKSIHTNSSTVTTIVDGTTVTTHTRTASAPPNFVYDVLRNNNSYGSHQVSCYWLGAYLVAENTAFKTAFDTYLL